MGTKATKAIRVSDYSHKQLNIASAKSGWHVYEIVDSLVRGLMGGALNHAVYRNHDYDPSKCDGCADVEKILLRVKNGSKKEQR